MPELWATVYLYPPLMYISNKRKQIESNCWIQRSSPSVHTGELSKFGTSVCETQQGECDQSDLVDCVRFKTQFIVGLV